MCLHIVLEFEYHSWVNIIQFTSDELLYIYELNCDSKSLFHLKSLYIFFIFRGGRQKYKATQHVKNIEDRPYMCAPDQAFALPSGNLPEHSPSKASMSCWDALFSSKCSCRFTGFFSEDFTLKKLQLLTKHLQPVEANGICGSWTIHCCQSLTHTATWFYMKMSIHSFMGSMLQINF